MLYNERWILQMVTNVGDVQRIFDIADKLELFTVFDLSNTCIKAKKIDSDTVTVSYRENGVLQIDWLERPKEVKYKEVELF